VSVSVRPLISNPGGFDEEGLLFIFTVIFASLQAAKLKANKSSPRALLILIKGFSASPVLNLRKSKFFMGVDFIRFDNEILKMIQKSGKELDSVDCAYPANKLSRK